jgi:hypothetical protein
MKEQGGHRLPAPASRWSKLLVAILLVAFAGVFMWSQLPSGAYPTDLSRIGAGRPALVLAVDSNYAGGMRVMEFMNAVRGDYADQIDFLVAPLGEADGQAFGLRHEAGDGSVLLFAADGSQVGAVHLPQSEQELRRVLDAALPR